jgi:DNA primase large subunit
LKNCAEKAKGASSSGLTKKSFRKEINTLAKGRPRKKVLEMFALVLQQEHKKLAAKTSKRAKKTEIIIDESSDSENENMSLN